MIELILLGIGCTMIGLGLGFLVALWYINRRLERSIAPFLDQFDADGFVKKIGGLEDDRNNGNL